jgi:hypothetical protein
MEPLFPFLFVFVFSLGEGGIDHRFDGLIPFIFIQA